VKPLLDTYCFKCHGNGKKKGDLTLDQFTSVEAVLKRAGERLKPRSVYVLNAPYDGGTHLPDITIVSPGPGTLRFA
jgi:hypothetical protein